MILIFLFSLIAHGLSAIPESPDCIQGTEIKLNVLPTRPNNADYTKKMDLSMVHKVAAGAAIPGNGTIVDLGSGSGKGSFDLAMLYTDAEVVGVDLMKDMIEAGRENYPAENLTFLQGNVVDPLFPPKSVSAFFASSTFHEVSSYNDYRIELVEIAIRRVAEALQDGGIFVLRDFVLPAQWKQMVYLDLLKTDGKTKGAPKNLSTSAFFKVFAKKFHSSQHKTTGMEYKQVDSPNQDFDRFYLNFRDAGEFQLHKDYRESFKSEVQEEYFFLTQNEMERIFIKNGLRVISSIPYYNPYLHRRRFAGKAIILSKGKRPLPLIATNIFLTGEKVSETQGTHLTEIVRHNKLSSKYVTIKHLRNKNTGMVMEVASRPNLTLDILPYKVDDNGSVNLLIRQNYPRPILTSEGTSSPIDQGRVFGYMMEPLAFILGAEKPKGEFLEDILLDRAHISPANISAVHSQIQTFPSPNLIDEIVDQVSVEVNAFSANIPATSSAAGLTSDGFIREIEATYALRGIQIGTINSARLESAIYSTLLRLGKALGRWIGDEFTLSEQSLNSKISLTTLNELLHRPLRRAFEILSSEDPARGKYLEVFESTYAEKHNNQLIATVNRQAVRPLSGKMNAAAVLPIFQSGGEIYIGVEDADLPTVQLHESHSNLIATPVFRVLNSVKDLDKLRLFTKNRLKSVFGVSTKNIYYLGSKYFSSSGLSAEAIYPMVAEIDVNKVRPDSILHWIKLSDALNGHTQIKHGPLLTLVYRLAHAQGLLK